MILELTEEQEMILKMVKKMVTQKIAHRVEEIDRAARINDQSAATYCLRISFLRILPEPLLGSGSWTTVIIRGYL